MERRYRLVALFAAEPAAPTLTPAPVGLEAALPRPIVEAAPAFAPLPGTAEIDPAAADIDIGLAIVQGSATKSHPRRGPGGAGRGSRRCSAYAGACTGGTLTTCGGPDANPRHRAVYADFDCRSVSMPRRLPHWNPGRHSANSARALTHCLQSDRPSGSPGFSWPRSYFIIGTEVVVVERAGGPPGSCDMLRVVDVRSSPFIRVSVVERLHVPPSCARAFAWSRIMLSFSCSLYCSSPSRRRPRRFPLRRSTKTYLLVP